MNIETLTAKQEQIKVECEEAVIGGFIYKLQQYFRNAEEEFINYFKTKYINVINHRQNIEEFVNGFDFNADLENLFVILRDKRAMCFKYGIENAKLGFNQIIGYNEDLHKSTWVKAETTAGYINGHEYAQDAMDYIESQNGEQYGNMLHKLGKNIDKVTAEDIYKELKEGFEKLESVDKLAERVQKVFDKCSIVRANMIARTETLRAFNSSTIDSYRVAQISLVQWLIANDERTCDRCRPNNGRVFSISAGGRFGITAQTPINFNGYINDPKDIANFRASVDNIGIDIPIEIIDFKDNKMLVQLYSDKYMNTKDDMYNNLFVYNADNNNPKIYLSNRLLNYNLSKINELLEYIWKHLKNGKKLKNKILTLFESLN
jgi:SPP1 gp7 family putative phage head morphogenesis protein